ncbi:unnamed protein product [Auanema sp. JU1783]|nr:unnamed protein product [Auanema sp. JU1783]
MPRLRVPSLKVRQNAEIVSSSGTSGTPKRGRGGRRRGSSSRRGGRKSKPRSAPWEEEEEIEQNYGYESRSEEEEEEEEDEDFLVAEVEQPDVSEPESDHESDDTGEHVKIDPDSSDIVCPWLDDEANYPILELPESSSDIPVHADLIMDMIELYEIIRSYHRTLRLTAFSFEDFCAAMSSSDNSCLLSEIHMALLKICLKSDDEDQIHYSVNDTNNAFNIMVYCMDSMTYAEILRQYLESDKNRLRVPVEILKAVNEPNYPFVDIAIRVAVIAFLCYRFLDSTEYRKVLSNAGRFVNDDACRVCGKSGVVQWCHNCEASFHIACVGLTEKQDEYHCELCKVNSIRGVTDALPFEHLKSKQPLRMESLGRDRHGRIYWFVVRRLIIQDENESELFYYSTLPQLYEVFSRMDPHFLEYNLCKTFCEQLQEIAEQMSVTLELSIERFEIVSNKDIYKNNNLTCYLHLDNVNRMKHILLNLWEGPKTVKTEQVDEFEYQPLPDRLLPLLGVAENHLTNSFWSGYYAEHHVVKLDVSQFLQSKDYFVMGGCKYDDFFRKYRNHYNGHDFAESPAFRKKILDKKKYLSTRFAIVDEGDGVFQWSIARGRDMYGNDRLQAKYIEWTLARMAKKIPVEMMHQRWGEVSDQFRVLLSKADNYGDLSKALLMMECCMRRTLFLPQFWSSLGHTRLTRTTVDERDQQSKEMQRKKKEDRDLTMGGDDDDDSIIRVKYTKTTAKTCPQSLWRQRDEVYRVAGRGTLGGWMWVSRGLMRDVRPIPKYRETDDMDESERTVLKDKVGRLRKLNDRLLKWRAHEEAAREAKNVCYSPSCRMGLITASVTCDSLDISQLCYSSTCRATYLRYRELHAEDFKDTNTVVPARAFKKAVVPCAPEQTPDSEFKWPLIRPNKFTYRTSKRKSVLIIADNIMRKLAKSGGRKAMYIPNFSLSAKSNMTLWNYPCSRPCFDLCWRYLVTNARSLQAIALQLKILWFCVKWLEFDPGEEETDAGRLIVHQMDRDDIRVIVDHQELAPHGTYERYLLEIEALMLEDDLRDDDDDYNDRADRRVSRGSASRPKRSNTRVAVRKVKETTKQWIDGVELKVFEIRKYWERKIKESLEKQEQEERVVLAKEKIVQHKAKNAVHTPRMNVGMRSPMFTPGNPHMKPMVRPYPGSNERWKRVHTSQAQDYAYDEHDQNIDDDMRPSLAKRARIVFTTQDSPGSPNRRIANGYEYNGGMIIGGGRMIGQPVGDGMRRVTMSNGNTPQIGAEEVVTNSGQRVLRAAGGVDAPPSIERFDSPASGYSSNVSRAQPRQVVYSQQAIQRQTQKGKVLMIRRSDGSTQFLRPVNTNDGDSASTSGGPVIRAVVNQTNPSTSSEQNANTPGSVQRRIITTARTSMNGQQVMTAKPRMVSRLEAGDDQYVKRVALEQKPAIGSPGGMPVQSNVQLVRRVNRPVPIRTDQGYYGENASVDEYTQMADQGIRPPGRPPARVTQAYGYGRSVQRIISRNGSGVPVGQVMAVSSSSTNEDDFASYEEGYMVDGNYNDFPAMEQ